MPGLRAAVIIYTDAQLVAELCGLSLVGYVDLLQAARAGRAYPELYRSGVRYQREPAGSEVWQSPKSSYASRRADCEDLAAGWRVPELWLLGETRARPFVRRVSAGLRHILVERADGSLEDPSLCLGMHSAAEARAALAAVRPPVWCADPIPYDLPRWTP